MPKKKAMDEKRVLHLGFNFSMIARLNDCQHRLNAATKEEVIRRAIFLLEQCLDQNLYAKGDDNIMRQITLNEGAG